MILESANIMKVIVPYSIFAIIVIAGIAQILISNSVVKQTAGSKKYDAINAGHSARRIGYALIIIGVGLTALWSAGNANNGAIYKWTSIVAGIFIVIIGVYNAWQIYQHVKATKAPHPFKDGKNVGHVVIAVLQVLFGIVAICCGL